MGIKLISNRKLDFNFPHQCLMVADEDLTFFLKKQKQVNPASHDSEINDSLQLCPEQARRINTRTKGNFIGVISYSPVSLWPTEGGQTKSCQAVGEWQWDKEKWWAVCLGTWWGVTLCASSGRPARGVSADAGFTLITHWSGLSWTAMMTMTQAAGLSAVAVEWVGLCVWCKCSISC